MGSRKPTIFTVQVPVRSPQGNLDSKKEYAHEKGPFTRCTDRCCLCSRHNGTHPGNLEESYTANAGAGRVGSRAPAVE
jgi:hypothetical protein